MKNESPARNASGQPLADLGLVELGKEECARVEGGNTAVEYAVMLALILPRF